MPTWRAGALASLIADIRAAGATSLRAIAAELNWRGMLTRRGGKWQVSNVRALTRRLAVRRLTGTDDETCAG